MFTWIHRFMDPRNGRLNYLILKSRVGKYLYILKISYFSSFHLCLDKRTSTSSQAGQQWCSEEVLWGSREGLYRDHWIRNNDQRSSHLYQRHEQVSTRYYKKGSQLHISMSNRQVYQIYEQVCITRRAYCMLRNICTPFAPIVNGLI